ncbi:hypothetical protein MNBD_DELTA01-1481 [hydrothermal vent metagenome]|uniref:HEAT repeat domain-containing protein n=1 Tax=hydrothermal vent metagenome TaxID=652676 RepID=A0A3B0RIL3_9ZZZZ
MSTDDNDFDGISEEDLSAASSVEPAGVAASSSGPPKPPTRDKLSGIGALFGKTWGVFKARFWTLILILLLNILLVVIGSAIATIPALISRSLIFISVILIFLVILYVMARCYAALFYAIPRDCGVKDAFRETKGRTLSFLWIMALQMSVILGGYFLFIIPGIVLSIWLYFPLYVFIEEDERGLNSLLKSMRYVRGHGFSVFIRLFVLFLLMGILGAIPIAGPLLSLILTPFPLIFAYLLYHELREIKGDFHFQPSRNWKIGFIVVALIGPLLPIIIAISIIGTAGLTMLPMLMRGMTGMQNEMTIQMHENNNGSTTDFKITRMPTQTGNITADIKTLLNKDNQSFERGHAAMKLGNSGDQKAAKALIIALNNDESWIVRQNAAEALGRLKAKSGVAPLINTLEQDKSVFVRKSAATALGEINNRIAIGPLKKALKDPETVSTYKQDGSYTDVRSVAIAAKEALRKMEITANIQAPEAKQAAIVPKAAPMKIRRDTSTYEKTTKTKKVPVDTEKLAATALDKGKTTKERTAAIKGLRKNNDKKSMQVIIKALKGDPEWNVRQHAALGLGKYSDNSDARAAMKATLSSDKSVWVRRAAAQALKSKDRSTISAFIKALKEDKDSGVRGYSATYLGKIKKKYTATALINALDKEKNARTRVNIIKALTASGDKRAAAAIKRTLNKTSGKEKATVVEAGEDALKKIKTRKSTEPVKRWVKRKYTFEQNIKRASNMDLPWIDRSDAIRTLGNSGRKTATPTLVTALEKDPEAFVRREAAIALGRLGDVKAFTPLNLAIYDEDQGVREESYASLQKFLKNK